MASDSDSDEDFVTYGTPLEPLEEDEPIRKPIPVQDQTVKDEKGRYKRFHGAFTGGFSAGYFNTVGSKEGWAPSTFVSSRNQKAEKQNVRPEDFMDEEDFSEHGIAPQQITTTDDFASSVKPDQIRDKARAISSFTAPIPGDTLLEELIAPARSSIGVELLRKMGWKDGQGVGPRMKRRHRKQDLDVKMYGCALPPGGSEDSENDDEFAPENVTFAPKDVIPVDFTPKDDIHGLGYRGLDPLQALRGGSGASHVDLFTLDSDRAILFGDRKAGQQRKGGISGQAFGVGAMETEDDDIYHKDTMSNYDMVLGGEEPGDGLYGWTAPEQYRQKKKDSSRLAAYLGKILEGFTLASKPAEAKTVFPPPVLPRDYRPVHYFRPVVDTESVSPLVAQVLQASRGQVSQNVPLQGRHTLDSSQRREMLGETGLQGPRSVFELLDSKDRERLTEIRKATEEKRAALQNRFQSSSAPSDSAPSHLRVSKAQADVQLQPQASYTAQQALSVWSSPTAQTSQTFKPFEKNPSKQARYDRFISQMKQGNKDALESCLDEAMTEWERSRERDEFTRAALLYKPSSSLLSSRFTRAKDEDDTDTVEVTRDQEGDVDDKQAAVKMKMFGKLTRDTMEWHPDKLLCKRFNVPDPYPGSSIVGLPKVKRDKFSIFNFLSVTGDGRSSQAAPDSSSGSAAASASSLGSSSAASGKRSRWDVADQRSEVKSVKEAERQQEHVSAATTPTSKPSSDAIAAAAQLETSNPDSEQTSKKAEDEEEADEEEVRPPMDLFKAIFASSSDEKSSSSSEEDSGEEEEQEAVPETPVVTPALPVVPQAPPTSEPESLNADKDASNVQTPELDCEEFGPRLPPPGQAFPSSSSTVQDDAFPSSSGTVWEEKTKSKERHRSTKEHKRRKEKKHKKKSKKHKHKGKQKKKKAEETDGSSDESDSDGDVTKTVSVSNEELIQRLKTLRGKK